VVTVDDGTGDCLLTNSSKSGASAIQRGLPSHQQDLYQQKQKSSIDATTLQQETIMNDLL
jgi:hypothetical protein